MREIQRFNFPKQILDRICLLGLGSDGNYGMNVFVPTFNMERSRNLVYKEVSMIFENCDRQRKRYLIDSANPSWVKNVYFDESSKEEEIVSSHSKQEKSKVLQKRNFIYPSFAASKERKSRSKHRTKHRTTALSSLFRSKLFVFILTVAPTLRIASTEIIISPKDIEAVQGTSVFFNCSSSLPKTYVQWNNYPLGKSMQVVYAFGKINSLYADRFSVQDGHNLHISSVTALDAGTYECQDDFGSGERRSAELIVIETDPVCQSNSNFYEVRENDAWDIVPIQVTLSCYVQYQGNNVPTLEWTKYGDDQTITSGVSSEIRGNLFLHNLTLNVSIDTRSRYYNCRTAKAESLATCWADAEIIYIITTFRESADLPASSCESGTISIVLVEIVCLLFITCIVLISPVVCLLAMKFRKDKKSRKETGDEPRLVIGQRRTIRELEEQLQTFQALLKDPESQLFLEKTSTLP